MLAEMKGLYQVPVGLALDQFGYPSVIHAEFVADMNLAFARIDNGSGTDDDLEHLSGLIAELYWRMPVLVTKHAANAAPRKEASRNSVEHLLLGAAEREVTWLD